MSRHLARRLLFTALSLVVLPLLATHAVAEPGQPRFTYEGDHGVYRFHGMPGRDAVMPVLVAEPGVAGQLWSALATFPQPFALVETKSLAPYARLRDTGGRMALAVSDALVEAAGIYRDLPQSPWIAVGAGASAARLARVVFLQENWQGLVLLGDAVPAGLVPTEANRTSGLEVLLAVPAGEAADALNQLEAVLKQRQVAVKTTPLAPGAASPAAGGALAAARLGVRRLADEVAFRALSRSASKTRRAVEFEASDGLLVSGDLYDTDDRSKPIVVLFHQARSSRGEYVLIAPRLVRAGFNCLAIDQRSGDHWSGLPNQTKTRAEEAGKAVGYIDARPDLDAAIEWVRANGYTGKLAIVGSSYSSSLAIFVGAETEAVSAVVSFSPGDYLPPRGSILEAAAKLTKPTLVICPPREERQATQVFAPLAAEAKELYVQQGGIHGASTLYRSSTHAEAWARFLGFLEQHLK